MAAPPPLAQCESCGVAASTLLNCTACTNSQEHQPGDSLSTVYCSRNCQTKDWPNHKFRCRLLGQRKKLLRTATILKAAVLTYREVHFELDLTKIDVKDGVLCLYQRQKAGNTPVEPGLFPDSLTPYTEHKEAALAKNQSTLAMVLSGRLCRKLLEEIPFTIEVLELHVGEPLVPTKVVPSPDDSRWPHTVLKVGMPLNDEQWVIDTTGCQYGFREVLIPYTKYIDERSCKISNGPMVYDAIETKDLDYFSTVKFLNETQAQRDDISTERRARLHFAAFVEKSVSKDVLSGSAPVFTRKVDKLVQDLRMHMLELGNESKSEHVGRLIASNIP